MNFGRKEPDQRTRPEIREMARVQSGAFFQLILNGPSYCIFADGVKVEKLDSLTVTIRSGDDAELDGALSTFDDNGKASTRSLFPGTIEIYGFGRVLTITAAEPHSLDGLWLTVGLDETGLPNRLRGLASFDLAVTEGIFSAKIAWLEGDQEDLFPELLAVNGS